MANDRIAREEPTAASSTPSDAPRVPLPVCQDTARKQQVRDALTMLFGYRLLNALCVRTFFQPDEYFQALEPAWRIAFGHDSGPWMTWEWQHKLRSSLHPGLFSLGYFIVANYMRSMPFDDSYTALALVIMPKVMQAGIAALSDWYAWRLGEKLYGRNSVTAWSVLLANMANPWHWYISTRTFSNTFEATLTTAALYYLPWELFGLDSKEKEKSSTPVLETSGSINSLRLSIILASIAVLLRPTNVLIWAILGTILVTRFAVEGESPLNFRTLMILVRESLLCGTLVLALSLFADHGFYGEWTFPPYSFLHYNLAQALAIFYGQNDGHYYLSQGIPLSFTTAAPFVVIGLLKAASEPTPGPVATKNAVKVMGFAATGMISALSLISHKEVRFIYPLVPMLSILAAPHITSFFTEIREGGIPTSSGPIGIKRKGLLGVGLLVNILIAAYLSWFHAAAPIQVMGYLRGEFERIHGQNLTLAQPLGTWNASSEPLELFALFLTPCHTTPWRSHLVYPALRARELTCEPPLHTEPGSAERAAYVDEGWRFERDKVGFMSNELWPEEGVSEQIPRYIVGFQGIEDALQEYFGPSGPGATKGVQLTQTWKGWNGLFTDDDRKAGELRVWDTNHYAGGAAA